MATCLVLGAFEVLHADQLAFLQRASTFGDVVVGLTGDDLLEQTKRPPIYDFAARKTAIERHGFRVVERAYPSARSVFLDVAPKFFVCGNDWLDNDHLKAAGIDRDFLNAYDITVVYTPRGHDRSSTDIIRRARETP